MRDKHQPAAHNAAYHLINTPLNLLFHRHCAGPSRQPRARCSNHSVNVSKLRLQVSFCGISGAFGQVGSGGRGGGRMLIRSRGSRRRWRRHQASLNGGKAHEEALMDRMVSVAGQTSLKSEVKKTFLWGVGEFVSFSFGCREESREARLGCGVSGRGYPEHIDGRRQISLQGITRIIISFSRAKGGRLL